MKILAFETSTPTGGVALLVDGVVVGEMRVTGAQEHSRRCLQFAGDLMACARLGWRDLDAVAASVGPGSFTGVRVAVTLAKGLAVANGLSCIAVPTLEAMAEGAHAGEAVDLIVPLIDARIGEVYGAAFCPTSAGLERVLDDFCVPPSAIREHLPAGRVLFSGEGARRYFDEHLSDLGILARGDRLLSSPAATALVAGKLAQQGALIPPGSLSAIYLREATTTQPKV